MKRFQLLTTAIFLFCTLLIAGCTGRGVEAQATPTPEATPTATTDIRSGIQTGDSEVNKILAGTWAFERTDADKKADDDSITIVVPTAIGHAELKKIPKAELYEWIKAGI